jgi:hypothetical protein
MLRAFAEPVTQCPREKERQLGVGEKLGIGEDAHPAASLLVVNAYLLKQQILLQNHGCSLKREVRRAEAT